MVFELVDANSIENYTTDEPVVHDFDTLNDDTKKFYYGRYVIFTKFDEGILMTNELFYSVTPEVVAEFIAKYIKGCIPDSKRVLDVFCGGGGNLIQFAKTFESVCGLEYNADNLKCCINNCKVYGVQDNIDFLYADFAQIAKSEVLLQKLVDMKFDVVFGSPPWNGPSYLEKQYDLETLSPLGLTELLQTCKKIARNIVLFLPRNSDIMQLNDITVKVFGAHAMCKVIKAKIGIKPKAYVCCWGESFFDALEKPTETEAGSDIMDVVLRYHNPATQDKKGPRSRSRKKRR